MIPRVVLLVLLGSPAPPVASCAWVRAENDGSGAGVVVDAGKRLLVTCRHVVADRPVVNVYFPWYRAGGLVTDRSDYLGNRPLLRERGLLVTGKVIRRDDATDLALVELESLPPGVRAVEFSTTPARPGDPLRVVGHRLDLDTLWNVTTGPARQTGRLADGYDWRGKKLATNANVILGQLPIEEGDSGGPVVNARGELVGMAAALRRQAPTAALVISAAEIRKFLSLDEPKSPPPTAGIADTLTRATVWVRPSATDFHTAGVLIGRGLVLTSARGVGLAEWVGVAFPLRDGGRWVGEREPYRDPVGLHLRGAWRSGVVIARDPARDLAVIRVESVPECARPVRIADQLPAPGDPVHAMNHPGGLEFAWVYSAGSVRQRGRVALGDGDKAERVGVNLLQLPAQAGSPGGPVLNARGELVGVLAARESAQQTGYATTTAEIARFLAGIDTMSSKPFDRSGMLERATAAAGRKEWRAARGELERLIDVTPANAEARQRLVGVLLELGKDDEAAAAVRDTLRADPKRLPALAADLLEQADTLTTKFPDSPATAAGWLRKAVGAVEKALTEPKPKAELREVIASSDAAPDDAARLTVLRSYLQKLPKR